MLRLCGTFLHAQQGDKAFLQNIFRFAVAQAQSSPVQNQVRSFSIVKPFTPILSFRSHFQLETPSPAPFV